MKNKIGKFKQIIIWGHKYHSHTHSYIHAGYYRAFKKLGFNILWLDDSDKIDGHNFHNSLFITEGNVEKNIPILDSSKYVVAYADRQNKILGKYKYENLITLSSRQFDEENNPVSNDLYSQRLDNYSYLRDNSKTKVSKEKKLYRNSKYTLFQPWATDLLPSEIIKIKKNNDNKLKNIFHIGTIHKNYDNYFGGYLDEIKKNNKRFICKSSSGSFKIKSIFRKLFLKKNNLENLIFQDIQKNIQLINNSYVNAALQPSIQIYGDKKGYLPCRVFKNLSYGRLCGTNSIFVRDLFHGLLPYSKSSSDIYYDIEEKERNLNQNTIENLYNLIKSDHTYINRALNILKAFEK